MMFPQVHFGEQHTLVEMWLGLIGLDALLAPPNRGVQFSNYFCSLFLIKEKKRKTLGLFFLHCQYPGDNLLQKKSLIVLQREAHTLRSTSNVSGNHGNTSSIVVCLEWNPPSCHWASDWHGVVVPLKFPHVKNDKDCFYNVKVRQSGVCELLFSWMGRYSLSEQARFKHPDSCFWMLMLYSAYRPSNVSRLFFFFINPQS